MKNKEALEQIHFAMQEYIDQCGLPFELETIEDTERETCELRVTFEDGNYQDERELVQDGKQIPLDGEGDLDPIMENIRFAEIEMEGFALENGFHCVEEQEFEERNLPDPGEGDEEAHGRRPRGNA